MNTPTKEKIMNNAFQLFVDRSYEDVTMAEIAEKSDVSKGAVFHYFDSKYELAHEAVFNYMNEKWMPVYQRMFEMNSPEKMLKHSIEYTFDFFFENPRFMRLFMELYEKGKDEHMIEEHMEGFFKELLEMSTEIFEELGDENPRVKSHLLIACLDGLAFQFTFFEEDEDFPDPDSIKEVLYDIMSRKEMK